MLLTFDVIDYTDYTGLTCLCLGERHDNQHGGELPVKPLGPMVQGGVEGEEGRW